MIFPATSEATLEEPAPPPAGPGRGPRRINVVGSTGSGKTTLARRLSLVLGIPHVELDELHWAPGWTEVPDEVMRERVRNALCGDAWVADGNYRVVRDLIWPRADTVVWLNYSLPVAMSRLVWRILYRGFTRQELWHGNRETVWRHFLTRDSLILWLLQSLWRQRRQLPALLSRPEYGHLTVVRLRSPRHADAWVAKLERAALTEQQMDGE